MDRLFELVRKLTDMLTELTEIEREKIEAIRSRKVLVVEECMKSEQVYTLQFRTLEKKLEELLKEEGAEGIPLSAIIEKLPAGEKAAAGELWNRLQTALTDFRGVKDVAEDLLKVELHKMEKAVREKEEQQSAASGKQEHSFRPRKV